MLRLSLRSVTARKLRLLLTASAIVLGVAFVTGTLVLTDTSTRLFEDQFARATAGVDVVVRDAAGFGAAMGVEVERDPLPAELLDRVRAVDGVEDAIGAVRGSALLVVDGEAIVPKGPSLGLSWVAPAYNPFRIATGAPPAGPDDVVVDAATARQHDLAVGDTVAVSLADGTRPLRVSGTATFGDQPGVPSATVALVTTATAQELFGVDGYSEIQIAAAGPVPALLDRLQTALGDGVEIASSQDAAAASAAAAQDQLAYLNGMLLALAATALVVGAFMIANTFAIVVAQRTREHATLRALGATGRQVLASVLVEAALLGTVSSAAGVAAGIGTATGMRRLAAVFGVPIPDGALVVAPRTLLVGVVVGLSITLLSAVVPARRAARTAPVAAMRDSDVPVRAPSRRRVVSGLAVAVVAAGVLVTTATRASLPLLGVGGVLVLAATVLVAPAVAGPAAEHLGRVLPGGVPTRLARRNLRRNARRTAATATALTVGLAVVTFMTVVAGSVKAAVGDDMAEVIRAELIVRSARGEMLGGLSPHVADRVSEVDGVAAVSRLRFGHWLSGTTTQAVSAIDPDTFPQVARLELLEGRLSDLQRGGIILAANAAERHGVEVGDRLDMRFSRTGDQQLEVVGLFDPEQAFAVSTGYLVGLDTYAAHFAEDVDAEVFVRLAPETDPAAVRAAVEDALEEFPTAAVNDQAAAAAERTRMLDSLLGLVTALLALAVLVALLGITNALALAIVERTREVGMLRAVGTTRRQITWMVRTEAALTALVGAAGGIGLGLALAAAAVPAIAGRASVPLAVPTGQLTLYLAVAAVGGVLAGLGPGRRAARMDVIAAVASN